MMQPDPVSRQMARAITRGRRPDQTSLLNNRPAIQQFQRFHGLDPDGIVGPLTRAKMRQTNTTLVQPPPPRMSPGRFANSGLRRM